MCVVDTQEGCRTYYALLGVKRREELDTEQRHKHNNQSYHNTITNTQQKELDAECLLLRQPVWNMLGRGRAVAPELHPVALRANKQTNSKHNTYT